MCDFGRFRDGGIAWRKITKTLWWCINEWNIDPCALVELNTAVKVTAGGGYMVEEEGGWWQVDRPSPLDRDFLIYLLKLILTTLSVTIYFFLVRLSFLLLISLFFSCNAMGTTRRAAPYWFGARRKVKNVRLLLIHYLFILLLSHYIDIFKNLILVWLNHSDKLFGFSRHGSGNTYTVMGSRIRYSIYDNL